MKKQKLNFRFHDPNPPGVAADAILHLLVEANMGKLEKAIREAAEAAEQEKSENPKKPKKICKSEDRSR